MAIHRIDPTAWNSQEADIKGVLDEGIENACDYRLSMGERRYGNSWCEVDLKEDFMEEMLDAINYLRFMEARARLSGVNLEEQIANMIGTLLGTIQYAENSLPEFVGPTSNDWVKSKTTATTYDLS